MQCVLGDHNHFIVIIIFYVSKNNNYKLLCKSDLTVIYYFGCSTCNSGPFFFKIIAIEAYLQGVHLSNSNRTGPVLTGSILLGFFSVFFSRKVKLRLKVQLFPVIVWSQSSFFSVNRTGLLITRYSGSQTVPMFCCFGQKCLV